MNKGEFVFRIQELAGIQDTHRAERATGAVLGTLCGRLTHDEASDLEGELPQGIESMCKGSVLKEMIARVKGPSRMDRDAFVNNVAAKARLESTSEAEKVTNAVFKTIKEQITPAEAAEVAAQLPQKLKVMWLES